VTLLDAYALVAVLTDEPAADEVDQLMRRDRCAMTIVNLAEALDIVHRRDGVEEHVLRTAIEPLLDSHLAVHASDAEEAWLAASIRGRYYNAKSSAISVADCLLLAAATTSRNAVATADPAVAAVARQEGIGLFPLPDSTGARP